MNLTGPVRRKLDAMTQIQHLFDAVPKIRKRVKLQSGSSDRGCEHGQHTRRRSPARSGRTYVTPTPPSSGAEARRNAVRATLRRDVPRMLGESLGPDPIDRVDVDRRFAERCRGGPPPRLCGLLPRSPTMAVSRRGAIVGFGAGARRAQLGDSSVPNVSKTSWYSSECTCSTRGMS